MIVLQETGSIFNSRFKSLFVNMNGEVCLVNMNGEVCFENILRPDLANPRPSANLEFNDKVNKLKESGRKITHLAFGQSPFPVHRCLQDALKDFAHVSTYLSTSGIKSLRKQIVNCHRRWDGINLNEDCIVIGPGSKELIFLTIANFNGVVLLPTPAWPTYEPQCKIMGVDVIKIDTNQDDSYKLSAEALTTACKDLKQKNKILIFTNPGNPNGQCYTEDEVNKISQVCRREGVIVFSDEIYARVTHSKKHYCMSKFYPDGTILYSGFSKWLCIGGWRIGYAYFPPTLKDLLKAVNSAASHTYTSAPSPMQFAIEKCLRENYDELEIYRRNCSMILKTVGEFCHRELKSVGVTGNKSEAGYYYLPNFEIIRSGLAKRGILTGKQMTEAMLDEIDVGLISTGSFGRSEHELCVRFCFVCFDGNLTLNNMSELTEGHLSEDEFIRKFCPQLYEGIQNLKSWVLKHKN